jgi:hypothetical protein
MHTIGALKSSTRSGICALLFIAQANRTDAVRASGNHDLVRHKSRLTGKACEVSVHSARLPLLGEIPKTTRAKAHGLVRCFLNVAADDHAGPHVSSA